MYFYLISAINAVLSIGAACYTWWKPRIIYITPVSEPVVPTVRQGRNLSPAVQKGSTLEERRLDIQALQHDPEIIAAVDELILQRHKSSPLLKPSVSAQGNPDWWQTHEDH
jgi:hypothetical protein